MYMQNETYMYMYDKLQNYKYMYMHKKACFQRGTSHPIHISRIVHDLMTQIRHIASIVVTYEEADPRVSKAVLWALSKDTGFGQYLRCFPLFYCENFKINASVYSDL